MEAINMGELKIENMNGVNAVNAPANAPQIKKNDEDTLKDTQKSTEQDKQEATTKHVIMYVGSSEYKDSTGFKWHKNMEKTYDEQEFACRKDLQFMINYGEMKHTVVTM